MDDTILKMLQQTGSTGIALGIVYLVYKIILVVKQRRIDRVAGEDDVHGVTGLPVLGGTNPAGVERSGLVVSPEARPVTQGELNAHCKAIHAVTDSQLGSVNLALADTNTKIDKMETKLDTVKECVGEIRESVAVLKDRTERS